MKFKRFSILLITTSMFLAGCGDTPAPDPGQHTHVWGDPTYVWAGDYSTCTATSICTLDATHVQEEESRASYEVITAATETEEGLGRYTATFSKEPFTTQTKDVTIPVAGPVDSFEKAINSIKTNHNYSAHLNNQWANETEPFVDYNFYNIDDNAMFDDFNSYFYSGYLKQKGQGIVTFQLNKTATTTGGLVLGNFVATNLERTVSDIYTLAVEHLVDKPFTYDETDKIYKSTSMDAMAVLANLAFGDYTSLVSAPEYITAKFENNVLTFRGVFDISYFDEVEVHTTGDVTLVVSNFEKTRNSVLEGYIANPDYTYTAPTEWDSDTIKLFNEEFNGYIPPFIEGLSYAWKSGQSVSEGYYVAMVEDYFSGDLTTKYRQAIEAVGFSEVSNPGFIEYKKVVEDENLVHTYSIKMKYYAPTDTDSSHMQYGYLYPNGVTSFKFLHKQQTKQTIVTVALLNEYIGNTDVGPYFPKFSLANDTRVANFSDASNSDENMILLLKGTNSAFFNIYPDTKQHAVEAVEKLVADLKLLGFEGSSSASFQQYWLSDDYFSQVKITDPSYSSTWSSSSYLQVRIEITQASLDNWKDEPVTLDSISISGQTTTFNVGDTFVFDGTVTAHYSDGTEEVVTPTSYTTPDMTQAGQQSVVVSYTNSKGETVGTDYLITINASEVAYAINIVQVTGATITVTYPTSLQAKAGTAVNFKVKVDSGYTLNSVSVTSNGESVSYYGPNPMTGAYQFTMPEGEVTITANVTSTVSTQKIVYQVYDTSYNVLNYNDVIDSSSTLPTNAPENSDVSFNIVTKSGYTFQYVCEINDEDAIMAPSFTYHMGTEALEFTIVVSIDPVTPATLSSIALSGQSTTYEVNETFSFDGTVTATYSDGSSKTVTPTSVSTPDMSTTGSKTVTVSYTEGEETKTATYTITVTEEHEESSIYGSYSHDRESYTSSNPEYYDRYIITLNEDGTGTYVREFHNANPSIKTMSFTYTISGSKITFTYASGENTDAYNGYRLFSAGPSEGYTPTNTTGVINADGSISVTLYKSSGADNGTFTFKK